MALNREFLIRLDILPAEIARFSKRAHFRGSRGKLPDAGTEAPVEEFGKRAITHRLELGHFDVVLADEWLNLACAQARVLIKSVNSVIDRLGLDPLRKGTLWLALVVGLVVV